MAIVLQKFIADSGYCSRRRAEELIKAGRVQVNGDKAEVGMKAGQEDEVKVDNKAITPKEKKIYIKLNKPEGYTCTNKKFSGENNVFDLVETEERLFVAGRLDKDSRGLVLLTNDGEWAHQMTHPSFEHEKEYLVKFKMQKSKFKIDITNKLLSGIDIGNGDGVVSAKKVKKISEDTFKIVLVQGKNRQIRRMFEALGVEVKDLKRVRIGDIKLGDLKTGQWVHLK